MAEMAEAIPQARRGYWYCIKRVPNHVAHLDKRGIVQLSTGIRISDDPRKKRATPAVQKLATRLARYWDQLLNGMDAQAIWDNDQKIQRANHYGLPYLTSDEVSKAELPTLMHRVAFAERRGALEESRIPPRLRAGLAALRGDGARLPQPFGRRLESRPPLNKPRSHAMNMFNTAFDANSGLVPEEKKYIKRYPFVFLVDISASTGAEPDPDIHHINKAIAQLTDMLRNPPPSTPLYTQAKSIDLCILAYNESVRDVVPWSTAENLPASIEELRPAGGNDGFAHLPANGLSRLGTRPAPHQDP